MSHVRSAVPPPISKRGTLADGTATTLYTVEGAILGTVVIKLHLCNKNANPANITIVINDGTDRFWKEATLAADADTDIEFDTVMRSGDFLQLTGAASVHWHLELVEQSRSSQGQQ